MSGKKKSLLQLNELFVRFRKGILFAVSLLILEHIAWIVEPAVFGKVIDALIARVTDQSVSLNETLLPLFLWIGVFAVNSGTGVVRRIVDERIYLAMFTQLATEISSAA
jgi:uncharacterized membrane protein